MLLIFLSVGCNDEASYIFEEAIDSDLIIYFERFAVEGNKRGVSIDWEEEDIHAMIIDIDEEAVGQCLSFERGRNEINIDKKYWEKIKIMDREFIVFHELGHCVLGRSHLDQTNLDGTCKSIMNSTGEACKKNYTLTTRDGYLDELFSKQ